MRLQCPCGAIIYDGGYPQPDKAWLVTSEALDDFLEKLEERVIHVRKFLRVIDRDMFQCGECGRLFIEGRNGGYCCFLPANDLVPKDLFRGGTGSAPSPGV